MTTPVVGGAGPLLGKFVGKTRTFGAVVYRWRLFIGPDLYFDCDHAPNALWRLMQWLVLGHRWERL